MRATQGRLMVLGLAMAALAGPLAASTQATPAEQTPPLASPMPGSQGPSQAAPLSVTKGQVVHAVVREYERHPGQRSSGPPHLEDRWLFPETRVVETWAVADDNDRIRHVVAYTRDAEGQLIAQTVIDESAHLTTYDARHQVSTSVTFPERGHIGDVGGRMPSLQEMSSTTQPQARRQQAVGGRPATVLEYRYSGFRES